MPTVTGDWVWDDNYSRAYAETDDPRVLAVIEREEQPSAPDGDVTAPAYWATPDYAWQPSKPHFSHGFDAPDALRILEAFKRADERLATHGWNASAVVDRYLRIFYDAGVRILSTQRYRNDEPLIFLDTPAWRAHVGIVGGADPGENLAGDLDEAQSWLDGDVYGIGWAINAARVDDETPVEDCLDDFDFTIECWGFYGTIYAKEAAAAFGYGEPTLHPLLLTN